jgi:hypothetical protein
MKVAIGTAVFVTSMGLALADELPSAAARASSQR